MSVFVDTSALIAVLNVGDVGHARAHSVWHRLLDTEPDLVTSSYVVVEALALTQSRYGMDAVRTLHDELLFPLAAEWVTQADHHAGVAAMLAANRRSLSLVDCVSFEVMRRLGVRRVFAFDPHFAEQGFEVLPAQA